MGVLSGLKPEPVFHFFEEICNIPHGSGNEKQLSDYIRDFADKRGLNCIQDELNNIIITKPASVGYESEEPVILQGHMDMVAVKEPDLNMDMSKDPLTLERDKDLVRARGTSLGGDDGIAVAYSLALLDSHDIPHPPLEVILTVGEEVGMDGAKAIDVSMLKGRRMLNLDNEEEGVLLVSCAGGARADCKLPVALEKRRGIVLDIEAGGLMGGHSGAEIDKEGGNSNCLMGRALEALSAKTSAALISLKGGAADNAIPILTGASVVVEESEVMDCLDIMAGLEKDLQTELSVKDPGVYLTVKNSDDIAKKCAAGHGVKTETDYVNCLTKDSMKKAAAFIMAMPNGVQAMSSDVEGLVETSLNLGIMELTDEALLLGFSIRSSLQSAKEALIKKLEAICTLAGADIKIRGDYPGWAYRQKSPLRDKMVRIYEEMYGKKPRVEAIHAGLECGMILDKIEDLDCVSYGPDMKNIHTTNEVLSISSVNRVWEYLLEILKRK